MDGKRYLIVTADDFGIGPATSQGILDVAAEGLVTNSVLLVNSPYAEYAVRAWRQTGELIELGWHPCLTLDRPVLPAERVPSLVNAEGEFLPLGRFLRRVLLGRINAAEVAAEFRAQYERFRDLVGRPPTVVNSHQHIHLFRPANAALLDLLARQRPLPYLRKVREPWRMLLRIRGAKLKRFALTLLGRRDARRQRSHGFPGNDWLAGITDPQWTADPQFLARWLGRIPGQIVELACHPGYWDDSLLGRDCTEEDGGRERRVHELQLLRHPSFRQVCRRAGFLLVAPGALRGDRLPRRSHAA